MPGSNCNGSCDTAAVEPTDDPDGHGLTSSTLHDEHVFAPRLPLFVIGDRSFERKPKSFFVYLG